MREEELRIVTVSTYASETLARADHVFLEGQGIAVAPFGYYYRKMGPIELRVPIDQAEHALELLRSIGRSIPEPQA